MEKKTDQNKIDGEASRACREGVREALGEVELGHGLGGGVVLQRVLRHSDAAERLAASGRLPGERQTASRK